MLAIFCYLISLNHQFIEFNSKNSTFTYLTSNFNSPLARSIFILLSSIMFFYVYTLTHMYKKNGQGIDRMMFNDRKNSGDICRELINRHGGKWIFSPSSSVRWGHNWNRPYFALSLRGSDRSVYDSFKHSLIYTGVVL